MGGDPEASGELLDRYRERALSWAVRVVKNATQAEEVVADVTLKALETVETLREPGAFSTWFYRMVFRHSLNSLRDQEVEAEALLGHRPADEAGVEDLAGGMDPERLRSAVEDLPPDLRIVLVMRYWEGLSFTEVARKLGIPEGTVKVRSFRAHRRLKGLLAAS